MQNEMYRALGQFCSHTGKIGPEEPPEDGEMNEMTLPSRHRIRNSNPHLSVTEAPHNTEFYKRMGRPLRQGNEPRILA